MQFRSIPALAALTFLALSACGPVSPSMMKNGPRTQSQQSDPRKNPPELSSVSTIAAKDSDFDTKLKGLPDDFAQVPLSGDQVQGLINSQKTTVEIRDDLLTAVVAYNYVRLDLDRGERLDAEKAKQFQLSWVMVEPRVFEIEIQKDTPADTRKYVLSRLKDVVLAYKKVSN